MATVSQEKNKAHKRKPESGIKDVDCGGEGGGLQDRRGVMSYR